MSPTCTFSICTPSNLCLSCCDCRLLTIPHLGLPVHLISANLPEASLSFSPCEIPPPPSRLFFSPKPGRPPGWLLEVTLDPFAPLLLLFTQLKGCRSNRSFPPQPFPLCCLGHLFKAKLFTTDLGGGQPAQNSVSPVDVDLMFSVLTSEAWIHP